MDDSIEPKEVPLWFHQRTYVYVIPLLLSPWSFLSVLPSGHVIKLWSPPIMSYVVQGTPVFRLHKLGDRVQWTISSHWVSLIDEGKRSNVYELTTYRRTPMDHGVSVSSGSRPWFSHPIPRLNSERINVKVFRLTLNVLWTMVFSPTLLTVTISLPQIIRPHLDEYLKDRR